MAKFNHATNRKEQEMSNLRRQLEIDSRKVIYELKNSNTAYKDIVLPRKLSTMTDEIFSLLPNELQKAITEFKKFQFTIFEFMQYH